MGLAGDDAHRLERAHLLRHLRHLLDAELEGDLAVVDDAVAAAQRRVHLLDRREVELREHALILRRGRHLRAVRARGQLHNTPNQGVITNEQERQARCDKNPFNVPYNPLPKEEEEPQPH